MTRSIPELREQDTLRSTYGVAGDEKEVALLRDAWDDKLHWRKRAKRLDRLEAKQFNRVIGLDKAEQIAKPVSWMPLKLHQTGKINTAQLKAAVRYRDELDTANGVHDGGTGAASSPGGEMDARIQAAQAIDRANQRLGRDGRATIAAVISETSMHALADRLRCARDTALKRVEATLDRLDHHWSHVATPQREPS